jgi:hypothetical protein
MGVSAAGGAAESDGEAVHGAGALQVARRGAGRGASQAAGRCWPGGCSCSALWPAAGAQAAAGPPARAQRRLYLSAAPAIAGRVEGQHCRCLEAAPGVPHYVIVHLLCLHARVGRRRRRRRISSPPLRWRGRRAARQRTGSQSAGGRQRRSAPHSAAASAAPGQQGSGAQGRRGAARRRLGRRQAALNHLLVVRIGVPHHPVEHGQVAAVHDLLRHDVKAEAVLLIAAGHAAPRPCGTADRGARRGARARAARAAASPSLGAPPSCEETPPSRADLATQQHAAARKSGARGVARGRVGMCGCREVGRVSGACVRRHCVATGILPLWHCSGPRRSRLMQAPLCTAHTRTRDLTRC